MAVIDADTPVIETEPTWNYLDSSEQQFRPIVVTPPALCRQTRAATTLGRVEGR